VEEPPPASRLVTLTFDDGPDPTLTGAVLDKLEAHGVPASFFLIGQQITADDTATLQRAAALGCTFENHSDDFNSVTGVPAATVTARVNAVSDLIEQTTGQRPAFFRAPNLQADATVFAAIDLPLAGGILTGDYPGGGPNQTNPTVDSVVNVVRAQIQDGSIILMHDVQPGLNPQVTPDALDIIIPELQGQGYEFVNIRELFARRGIDPASRQDADWDFVPPNP
jgi:peptidoglycan/xylan/chitin deacetylase (PgdA/CDA1 family)